MHVAQVIGNSQTGGAEHHLLDLVKGLTARGVRVSVLAPRSGPLTQALEIQGHTVERIEMVCPRLGDEYSFNPRAHAAIVDWLRLAAPDVVHTHLYPAHLHASVAATELQVPSIVHTAHTLIVRPGDVVLARTTPARTIATSRAVQRILVDCGVPADGVDVVYNGVSAQHFNCDDQRITVARSELGLSTEHVIGTVARLSYEKGMDVLVRAAAEVRLLVPGIQVCIVGDGPQRQSLETLVNELGLSSSVQFLGLRNDVDVLNRLWDVFALPSREEACPLALMEAMAAGCAVVASDVGGVSELVQDRREGVLVASDDAHALAQALIGVLRAKEWRRELASAARAKSASFSTETMLRETLEVYNAARTQGGLGLPRMARGVVIL